MKLHLSISSSDSKNQQATLPDDYTSNVSHTAMMSSARWSSSMHPTLSIGLACSIVMAVWLLQESRVTDGGRVSCSAHLACSMCSSCRKICHRFMSICIYFMRLSCTSLINMKQGCSTRRVSARCSKRPCSATGKTSSNLLVFRYQCPTCTAVAHALGAAQQQTACSKN